MVVFIFIAPLPWRLPGKLPNRLFQIVSDLRVPGVVPRRILKIKRRANRKRKLPGSRNPRPLRPRLVCVMNVARNHGRIRARHQFRHTRLKPPDLAGRAPRPLWKKDQNVSRLREQLAAFAQGLGVFAPNAKTAAHS